MIEACLSRLLRGGSNTDLGVFLRLLSGLAPTAAEERERVGDWLALTGAASTVAGYAQTVLARLALDDGLPPGALAEMSAALLLRPEKKLARAQLVLLGKVMTRSPETAGELLPVVADAFGHEDADVRERAEKLVVRHLAGLADDAPAREALAAGADLLAPGPRTRILKALGVDAADAASTERKYEEVLPPAPVPARLCPPPASAQELAEEMAALLAAGSEPGGTAPAFERTLDGLVRWAYRDQEALREALEPVAATRWWLAARGTERDGLDGLGPFSHRGRFPTGHRDGLDLVLATLFGVVGTHVLHSAVTDGGRELSCVHGHLTSAFRSRLWEAAFRIRKDPQPFLLSTPTWSNGLLEPGDLVDRLEGYRRLGARVGENDLAQALLRLRLSDRAACEEAAARAGTLGTPAGARLAEWLTSAGPSVPPGRPVASSVGPVVEYAEVLELQRLPPAFRHLGRPVGAEGCAGWCAASVGGVEAHWTAVLPGHRELVAARLLRRFAHSARKDFTLDASALPLLAEADGEVGPALRLTLGYGLCLRRAEERLAAVDALLLLAASGGLDGAEFGADLAVLVLSGAVRPTRLADALRTAATGGAHRTVWSVLRALLPPLLAAPEPVAARALGDLVALAAECAERTGAGDAVAGLDEVADRRGSSRLVTQARRLRTALRVTGSRPGGSVV